MRHYDYSDKVSPASRQFLLPVAESDVHVFLYYKHKVYRALSVGSCPNVDSNGYTAMQELIRPISLQHNILIFRGGFTSPKVH